MIELKSGLIVSKIKDGTVIDHIPAGRALAVLKVLGIRGIEGSRIALVMNAESSKYGRKDILKIEDRTIEEKEAELITLIAPEATINIIKEYEVVGKRKQEIPDFITGLLKCSNPSCVTNNDPEAVSKFRTIVKRPIVLSCTYCETRLTEDEVMRQILG
ncbi:aspartate carbamoyltransferase regulatory subunit [Metallosphaera hakonensis]|uniref:Aspartate carbamoyltransferase regulatory chain n=1 Tax=Metallosphaera hakonensis JCM 8857 = DSM 7519 TaxID=1293036 RepID=A0A2U9IUT8_9CREN|nr:aspartate carbamoyltransferase regulatory subunit [Metallosphaera hakonensis]AWR99753.1 aspartate carbamoyltransferase regulatory subunit [Metallosphaera hakonensis JCM 8857 = DSM 7519]